MITERDRLIYNHIDRYNFATVEQIQKIFFREQKYGYDVARRRLNLLVKNEYLKATRNYATNQNIYYIDGAYKKISLHSVLLMNYYAELAHNGAEILTFDKEREFSGGKVRTDAFCIFIFNGYKYYQVIEVNSSHNKLNINKYEDKEIKTELLSLCNDVLPNIVLIDDSIKNSTLEVKDMEVIQLDFNLDAFPKVFI
jgi:hypothetical protein